MDLGVFLLFKALAEFRKRNFLLYYLTARDFKVKYRRSVLGVLWSVLNPLLMMFVVSAVFSYIFRQDIENFPVYLILGQVVFNFLSESTNLAMNSVLGAAPLIKKVYVPKYIFPFEKVLFSFINFLISFIAVAIVLIVNQVPLTISAICLPLFLIYLFTFCLGIGLLLSSVAVLFRDIIHLYGVIITAWTYLTPIFYPVTALDGTIMRTLMEFNPMFHYVEYMRGIILYHTFPSLMENLICIGFALLFLVIGVFAFKKNQDKFILYI